MIKSEIYASITEKIITNLEKCGSWQQLWQNSPPLSLNGHIYRGINRLMLANDMFSSRVYGTFQQIRSNGGSVRKGEKSTLVVFWKKLISPDPVTQEPKVHFLLRYFHIFNTEQADFDEIGRRKIEAMNGQEVQKTVSAEQIIAGYHHAPEIIYTNDDDDPHYNYVKDYIKVPHISRFPSADAFYQVLYHEAGHSTMHESRLNRVEGRNNTFGDENYCKEELVAELCGAFLSNAAGLHNQQNSTAYIQMYLNYMRENHRLIVWAASRAEKAAEYILGIQHVNAENEHQEVPEPAFA